MKQILHPERKMKMVYLCIIILLQLWLLEHLLSS